MKRAVVSRHRPYNSHEAHEDRDPRGKRRPFVDGAPYFGAGGEAGEAAVGTVGSGWDEDEDDDEGEDVEGGAYGVDLGEEFGGEGGHEAVDEHDEGGEEEGLVVGGGVGGGLDGGGGEDHGGCAVVDWWVLGGLLRCWIEG